MLECWQFFILWSSAFRRHVEGREAVCPVTCGCTVLDCFLFGAVVNAHALNIRVRPWASKSAGWRVIPRRQGCGFDPQSGPGQDSATDASTRGTTDLSFSVALSLSPLRCLPLSLSRSIKTNKYMFVSQLLCGHVLSFPLGHFLYVKFLGHRVSVCLTMKKLSNCFPNWLHRLTRAPA